MSAIRKITELATARLVPGLATFYLVALFFYAGLDKLLHYDGFVSALASYAVIAAALAKVLAPLVIAVEILIAATLLHPSWNRRAALAGAALLVLFTAVLGLNQIFAPGAVCGCWFTVTLAEGTASHVAFNLISAALAVTVWLGGRQDPASRPARPATATA